MGETRAPELAVLLPDGSRRRTVGGIFFYLVRGGVTPKERWRIWPQRATFDLLRQRMLYRL